MTVKRSMSVRPCPIVVQNGRASHPDPHHPAWRPSPNYNYQSGWTGDWGYIITRVTNSTDYRPGWRLTKKQVDALIEADWTVSVLSKV